MSHRPPLAQRRHLLFGALLLPGLLLAAVHAETGREPAADAPLAAQRIVALGGTITEIVYALGAGNQLVGVDSSSTHPADAANLPDVGYYRQVSAEGVLSLRPTLVLAVDAAGPVAALDQLRQAGVEVAILPHELTREGIVELVACVGKRLDRAEAAAEQVDRIDADFQTLDALLARATGRPRVAFVHARGPGSLHISGGGTAADAVIVAAGAVNACADFEGYRPLTAEGLIVANPDAIVLIAPGHGAEEARRELVAAPGVAMTAAARDERLFVMDGLHILGYGPREGRALIELVLHLHPELSLEAAPKP